LIRASAFVLLMLMGIIASIPLVPAHSSAHGIASNYQASSSSDPSPPLTAFNYTYSQANLYTNSSVSTLSPSNTTGTKLTWFSTVNQTSTNAPIPNTSFDFNITKANLAQAKEEVNWTLTVPQFNCQSCNSVSVNFNFFGNLTKGTNATYTLSPLSPPNSTIISSGSYTSIGSFPSAPTVGCPEQSCIDVTKYRGYHVTLSFRFAWNGTNTAGMFASVGEVVVSSIGNTLPSSSNVMQQTNSTAIVHTATLSNIKYNNTLTTYVQPGNVSTTQLWWHMEVVSIYYPAGYKINQVSINGTKFYPNPPEVAFEKDNCVLGTSCSVSLLALNVTDFHGVSVNSTITITAYTKNSINPITGLSTVSGGVATSIFTSGDQIGVKVVNQPSIVNASTTLQTGSLTISFPSALSIQSSTVSTITGGVYNFTLPSNCGPSNQLCNTPFTIKAVFTSGYDLGNATASFSIDLLQVSLTGTGGSNTLSVQGTLDYGNGNPASGINATLFAIDRGTPANTPYTNNATSHSSNRLYISNVTLVNGLFTQGQSLIILFTIINPNATQAFNATLTIAHDWPGPQAHNMTTSVFLGLGDNLGDFSFTNATSRTFEATISFTGTGVQVVVTSLFTGNHSPQPLTMTAGTSPVLPNAPHAGLFNFTITSMINNKTQSSPSTIFSPAYAYVIPALAPSRYLYSSQVFTTGSNGGFSQTISNPRALLAAENLTVFVLARDSSGVVVMNVLPSSIFTQSTKLISTADSIGPVAEGSTATATLHLKYNSTLASGITQVITVNLYLQGNGLSSQQPVATQAAVTISPGQSQTVKLSFTAPSTIGSYTLSFSSPEYGEVLTSQTVQVTILPGYVQYLIPAAIGVVAAIIILGVYLIRERRSGAEETEAEKPKGPSPKPKPATGPTTPAKSLTRTPNPRL
jgi:hypothetical protein